MKKTLTLLFALVCAMAAQAQGVTSMGTDFWLAFLQNWHPTDVDHYYISAYAPRSCSVTVTNPNSGWSRTFSVNGGSHTIFDILTVYSSECWQQGFCVTNNTGLHITATDSVSVVAYNHSVSPSTSDASLLLPTEFLGSEYIIQSYPISTNTKVDCRSLFSILAVENGTTVTIDLRGDATRSDMHNGNTVTVSLNAGQVFQVASADRLGDFSGTHIIAHDCKPIAVFSGSSTALVPTISTVAADHLFQQDPPVDLWRQEWILTSSNNYHSDRVRVTSSSNGCQVFVNGTLQASLGNRQSCEFTLTSPVHLTTSQPALVYQYHESRHSTVQGADMGDAAMFAPAPVSQTLRSISLPTFVVNNRDNIVSQYYANVVVPSAETALLRHNGQAVTGFAAIPGTSYSYVRITLSNSGSNTITTTGSGFNGYSYGLGENWDGYCYSFGGQDTIPIANPSEDFIIDTSICSEDAPLRIGSHEFSLAGSYRLGGNCSTGDTVVNLHFINGPNDTIADTVCQSSYTFGDTTLTVPGSYDFSYTGSHGCDSLVHVDLALADSYYIDIDTASCTSPLRWEGRDITPPGATVTYQTVQGCDSIITLNFTLLPSYDTAYVVTIFDTGQYRWVDGVVYDSDTVVELNLASIYGCDSILRLFLTTVAVPDTTPDTVVDRIWVPNVFTPGLETNSTFRIISKDIDEMTVSIYHRWGIHIVTFDGLTEAWDGTHNGVPCPQAAYVYHIRYHIRGNHVSPPPLVGTVLLLR